MGEQQLWSLEGAVQSYAHWWREAGLHTATDDLAHGWRDRPAQPFWHRDVAETGTVQTQATPAPEQRPAAPAVPAATPAHAARPATMPNDLPGFREWLAQDQSQPDAGWDGALMLPPGVAQARLMLILEMPGAEARDADSLIDPAQRRFLDAMLASIGLSRDDAPVCTLATRRAPGGLIDDDAFARLTARLTHYLGLARPRSAIILGDRMSRALIAPQSASAGNPLRKVNHGGGTMDALPLAGPELLMSRPVAKARSWQALRHLHGIVS